jgi:nicotinate-nucleotide adenylyltransferase
VKIGIFGGTFDPPHVGHLIVAQDAYEALALDRVLFVPAGVPPHKAGLTLTDAAVRMRMVEAAISGDDRFATSDVELRRSGPSYMVDTLRILHEEDPSAELHLLLGADQFRELHTWRSPEEIARLCRLILLSRGGVDAAPPGLDVQHQHVPVTRIDLSATDIRERAAHGRSIRYLVPQAVERIIFEERLYRAPRLAAVALGEPGH